MCGSDAAVTLSSRPSILASTPKKPISIIQSPQKDSDLSRKRKRGFSNQEIQQPKRMKAGIAPAKVERISQSQNLVRRSPVAGSILLPLEKRLRTAIRRHPSLSNALAVLAHWNGGSRIKAKSILEMLQQHDLIRISDQSILFMNATESGIEPNESSSWDSPIKGVRKVLKRGKVLWESKAGGKKAVTFPTQAQADEDAISKWTVPLTKKHELGKSCFRNIFLDRKYGKWFGSIRNKDGKKISVGYGDQVTAARAVNKALAESGKKPSNPTWIFNLHAKLISSD